MELMNVAFGHLSYVESFDKKPLPKTASVLGYDQDAKKAIKMMLAKGYPKSSILVSELDPGVAGVESMSLVRTSASAASTEMVRRSLASSRPR